MINKKIIVFLIMFFLFASGIKGYLPQTKISSSQKGVNVFSKPKVSAQDVSINQASEEVIIIKLVIGSRMIYINGKPDFMDVASIIIEGRMLLPIRYVAEPLGAEVSWDPIDKKVTVVLNDTTIELWIGKSVAKVNGKFVYIDPDNQKVVPIIIPPGRTMLPVRFVAENLGCKVEWEATTRTVTIIYTSPNKNVVSKVITPEEGGKVELSDGASVEIPEGAVEEDTIVSVRVNSNKDETPGVKIYGNIYDISLSKGKLLKPAKITLPLNPRMDDPYIVCWNQEEKFWEIIGGRIEGGFITAEVNHFSKYAEGELKEWNTDYDPAKYGFHFKNTSTEYSKSGICAGMVLSSLKLYQEGIKSPKVCSYDLLPEEWKNYLKDSFEAGNTLVIRYKRERQIMFAKQSTILSKIINNSLKKPLYIMVGLKKESGGGYHAILAYKFEKSYQNNEYYLYFYDPNFPSKLCNDNPNPELLGYESPLRIIIKRRKSIFGNLYFLSDVYDKNNKVIKNYFNELALADEKDIKFDRTSPSIDIEEVIFPDYNVKFSKQNICFGDTLRGEITIKNGSNLDFPHVSLTIEFPVEIGDLDASCFEDRSKGIYCQSTKNSQNIHFYIDRFSKKSEITLWFEIKINKKIEDKLDSFPNFPIKISIHGPYCCYRDSKKNFIIQLPDLIVEDILWEPINPKIRDRITFKATVKNIGEGNVREPFFVSLYIDGKFYATAQSNEWGLPSNGTSKFTFSPWTLTSGCHNIKVVVDLENHIKELNEDNNEKSDRICPKKLPDLIVEDISWEPSNPEEGDSVTIKAKIKNIGDATANGFDTKLYIGGSSYSTKYTSSLSPGSTKTITFSSWRATKGCKEIKVFVDSGYDVEESNENNNERVEQICSEKKTCDCKATIWTNKTTYCSGDPIRIYFKVTCDAFVKITNWITGITPHTVWSGSVKANTTYYIDGKISPPLGTEYMKIEADCGNGNYSTATTSYISKECGGCVPTLGLCKIRGTVIPSQKLAGNTLLNLYSHGFSAYTILVKIEQVLLDPGAIGCCDLRKIPVIVYFGSPCIPNWDEINYGDYVEVFGEIISYGEEPPDFCESLTISVCGEGYYINKITNSQINADIWIDKGCGSSYCINEPIRVFFKSNKSGTAKIIDRLSNGYTQTLGPWSISGGKTYYLDAEVTPPTGKENLTLIVNASDGSYGEAKCYFYVQNCGVYMNQTTLLNNFLQISQIDNLVVKPNNNIENEKKDNLNSQPIPYIIFISFTLPVYMWIKKKK